MSVIIRIVTGNDGGGVRTSELMYYSALKERDITVLGVIVGGGKSADIYKKMFEEYVELGSLPRFDGSITRKALNMWPVVVHALRESGKVKRSMAGGGSILAVTTRQQPTLLVAALIARSFGKDLYWHAPGPLMGGLQRAFLGLAKKVNRIRVIANSRYTATQLGVSASNVVYPGFDAKRLSVEEPGRYRKALGIPDGKSVYAIVARVNYEKASDLVVEGFVGSQPFEEGSHLVMAGHADRPEFLEKVRSYAQTHGKGQIHMLEFVEDVGNLIGDSDIVINGRRGPEPFGISIVEAMGSGKPVLAFGEGGPEETVRDGETGWLVKEATVTGYREALDRSWIDRDRWPEFGRQGKEFSGEFSLEVQVEKYLKVVGLR